MADINLSMGVRTNLLELTNTTKLLTRTNERLASGKDVNNSVDNPVNFFASMNLTNRATSLNARLDGIGQAVQTLKAAESGVKGVRSLMANMEALINQARDEVDIRARRALGSQFNQLLEQAQELAKDSGYQGTNLLQKSERLTVQFSDRFDQSIMKIDGINIQGPGIGGSGMRDGLNEVPPSAVTGNVNIAERASVPSIASVAARVSESSRASRASIASEPSYASIASIASKASVASYASLASAASAASAVIDGVFTPSRTEIASVASIASEASIASRPEIASKASESSQASISSRASVASRASIASQASQAEIAAQTITQQYAFTMNVTNAQIGTDLVLGIQAHGTNSTALGEHEIDWGGPTYRDQLKSIAIQIEKMDNALRVELSNISTNTGVLNIREEFTTELKTTLLEGSDKLVLADMNSEGANLLALQTRQQLGLQALQLASQQGQQLLRLLQ